MTSGTSREAMLQAVAYVLADEGLPGLSLRKVAARAGFSHAAPGVVFGDRAGLLTAFATMGLTTFANALEAATEQATNGRDALEILAKTYIHTAHQDADLFQVMFRTELLRENDSAYIAGISRVFDIIEATVSGHADKTSDDVRALSLLVWSSVHGVAMLWTNGQLTRAGDVTHIDEAAEQTAQQLIRLVCSTD